MLYYSTSGVFALFTGVFSLVGLLEFNRMALLGERVAEQYLSAVAGSLLIIPLYLQRFDLLLFFLISTLLLLALMYLFRLGPLDQLIYRLGWQVMGLIYVPLLLGHLVLLRQLTDGRGWVFLVLFAVMACDTMAYFVGVSFGKHKLYPSVSPKKSIEGSLGGLVGSCLGVWLATALFLPTLGATQMVLVGLLLGVAGQVGDLFESLLKRACGVKDSGAILPGHGGILDRLDSLLFAFPLAYYLARLLS
jgi:phosphatidate cytidylyltransferase